jgi:hypothetical protein
MQGAVSHKEKVPNGEIQKLKKVITDYILRITKGLA